MKYLFNRNRVAEQEHRFLAIELGDVMGKEPEQAVETKEVESATKEASFNDKSEAAMNMLGAVLLNKNPVLQKRILARFNKECGLDDGIIGSKDALSGRDTKNVPKTAPLVGRNTGTPYVAPIMQMTQGPYVPPTQETSGNAKSYFPQALNNNLVGDGIIDQAEYEAYVGDFTKQIKTISAEVGKEPLYKEDIDGIENSTEVQKLLSKFPEDLQEGMTERILSDINDPLVFSEYKTAEGLMTIDGFQKYIKEVSGKKNEYRALISASEKIDKDYRAVAFEVAKQLKLALPDWSFNNLSFSLASDGSLEVPTYALGVDFFSADQDLLTPSKQTLLGINSEDMPDVLDYLNNNADLISTLAKNTHPRKEKLDLSQKTDQEKILNLATRNIIQLADSIGVSPTLYNEDTRGTFTRNADGGISVDLLDKKDINYTFITHGDLQELGLSKKQVESFLTKNLQNIRGRLARNEITEKKTATAEYPSAPKFDPIIKEPAAAETDAEETESAANTESPENARKNAANKLFIKNLKPATLTSLGVVLEESDSNDKKVQKTQIALDKKGFTPANSFRNGEWDGWAGGETEGALAQYESSLAMAKKEPTKTEKNTKGVNEEITRVETRKMDQIPVETPPIKIETTPRAPKTTSEILNTRISQSSDTKEIKEMLVSFISEPENAKNQHFVDKNGDTWYVQVGAEKFKEKNVQAGFDQDVANWKRGKLESGKQYALYRVLEEPLEEIVEDYDDDIDWDNL